MARHSTPEDRNEKVQKERYAIRRRYKKDLTKRRKFIPGEEEFVGVQVAVMHIAGYNNTQIGRTIGLSRGQVRELLRKPDVADMVLAIRASLPEAAIQLLQSYMVEAITTLVEVMRISDDDKMRLQAAGEVLDRAGVPKASRQERRNIEESEMTIKADDSLLEQLRSLPPEKQEEAAQGIEQLQSLLAQAAETQEEESVDADD